MHPSIPLFTSLLGYRKGAHWMDGRMEGRGDGWIDGWMT